MATLLIVGLIFIVLIGIIGIVVFVVVRNSKQKNTSYEQFAQEHGYSFDKAMVHNTAYREYSSGTFTTAVNVRNNPLVDHYANLNSYPFGRGVDRMVSYVIEGNYRATWFRAFTYRFTGSVLDGGGTGGVFGVVIVPCSTPPMQIPEGVFCESGILCHYYPGNLRVETIHEIIDWLMSLQRT